MLPAELAQYKQLFLQTAWEYLRTLESSLILLKSDPVNEAAIQESHISAHSLKSQSLVMGFTGLGEVAHTMELFFKDLKEKKRTLTADETLLLSESVEAMKQSLAEISAHDTELDMQAVQQKLGTLHEPSEGTK